MRWPWDNDSMKANNKKMAKEVLDPAITEIGKAQVHLDRINKILREAKKAEQLVIKSQRR